MFTKLRDWLGKEKVKCSYDWTKQSIYSLPYVKDVNKESVRVVKPKYSVYRHVDTGERVAIFVHSLMGTSEVIFKDDKQIKAGKGETLGHNLSKEQFENKYDWIYGGEKHGLKGGHYTDLEAV